MAHYGMLRDYKFSDTAEDIRGSKLYGLNDEKLGKIDDVIFDHSTGLIRYIVVDTGGWLKTKKFLVPTHRLRASAKHKDDFEADLNKQQIEAFPPYNESDLDSEKKWNDYEGRYRSKWETGPVMHRAETDRNITPTTKQMQGGSTFSPATNPSGRMGSDRGFERADVEAAAAPSERIIPAGADTVAIDVSAVGIGGRWDTFQSRLRERRKEAVAGCKTCTGSGARSESAGDLRKAV